MSWVGRMYDMNYGLNEGELLLVISEPRIINKEGDTAVMVRDSSNSEYEVETKELEASIYYTER